MDTTPFLATSAPAKAVVMFEGKVTEYELEQKNRWLVGRPWPGNTPADTPDIPLYSQIAGRKQGEFAQMDGRWYYINRSKTNPTLYNNAPIEDGMGGRPNPVQLRNGDTLRVDFPESGKYDKRGVLILFTTDESEGEWKLFSLFGKGEVYIGRDPHCQILQPQPYISRFHAKITPMNGAFYLSDCDSQAGTWLNSKKVEGQMRLHEKDTISICDRHLIYSGGNLLYISPPEAVSDDDWWEEEPVRGEEDGDSYAQTGAFPGNRHPEEERPGRSGGYDDGERFGQSGGYDDGERRGRSGGYDDSERRGRSGGYGEGERPGRRSGRPARSRRPLIRASIRTKMVPDNSGHGKKELIRNVRLAIPEGSLVALLGSAGAGKSTVMNCLNGTDQEGVSGTVMFRGENLFENYERLRFLIGSVPQKNTFHSTLTVKQELIGAAQFRMGSGVSGRDIRRQVADVINRLGLDAVQNSRIQKLSGGEQRRVHVGIELVANRVLYCLDEPDAGLDPRNKQKLFQILRSLTREERKTIIVIIHDVADIDLFDQVILMTKKDNVGRLAFSGSPEEAREFFGVDEMKEVYSRLEADPAKYIEAYARMQERR